MTAELSLLSWPQRTSRLVLRPTLPEDAEAIHAYRSRTDVVRYLGHEELDLEGVRARLAEHAARTELPVTDVSALHAATGAFVGDGVLGLRHAGAAPSRREEVKGTEGWIGYCLAPEWHGQGLGTELAGALLNLAFGQLGLRRVVANAYAEHVASRRVLEKVGMRLEGTFRQVVLTREGRWLDDCSYAMLREEWDQRQRR